MQCGEEFAWCWGNPGANTRQRRCFKDYYLVYKESFFFTISFIFWLSEFLWLPCCLDFYNYFNPFLLHSYFCRETWITRLMSPQHPCFVALSLFPTVICFFLPSQLKLNVLFRRPRLMQSCLVASFPWTAFSAHAWITKFQLLSFLHWKWEVKWFIVYPLDSSWQLLPCSWQF